MITVGSGSGSGSGPGPGPGSGDGGGGRLCEGVVRAVHTFESTHNGIHRSRQHGDLRGPRSQAGRMRRLPAWLDDAVPLLAPHDRDALPRVISRADAMRRGIADHVIDRHVARRRWQPLCPGVYLTTRPPMSRDLLDAAVLHGGPGAVISAAAALREYGLRSAPDGDGVLLLVARRSGARPCGQIRVRRTSRLPWAEPRLGPPLAPPARAVADAAREMARLSDVRALVAEAVRRDLASVDDLSAELAAGRRNGSRFAAACGR
jgi:hypothetical protein